MPPRPYQNEVRTATYDYLIRTAQEKRIANGLICLPTGTGKGYCIADFVADVVQMYPGQRIMVATHVKELVRQNYEELIGLWEVAPAGVYSSGLNRKEHLFPITFAGVKSLFNALYLFEPPDIFIIDEAHLLSPKEGSSYQHVIKYFRGFKPKMIVLGHTATHWRTGQGLLTEGNAALFTDIIVDMTTMQWWDKFVREGYLLRPIPKRTKAQIDVSEVHIAQTGDYVNSELEKASDKITYEACREIVTEAAQRQSWLIFAAGVGHAEHVATMLTSFGIEALAVHSKLPGNIRDERIQRFKSASLRCVVNNNVLTTGFNFPGLDYIGMLRPTMSVGLWVQMLGRGTRPCYTSGYDLSSVDGRLAAIAASHKQDCLVSDFARNTERLGPINDPYIPSKKRKTGAGNAPVRICDKCGTYNHANASECMHCGARFEHMPKIVQSASTQPLFRETEPVIEEFAVNEVNYYRHQKEGMPDSIKIEYVVRGSLRSFTQYVHFEMDNLRFKTKQWWSQRSFDETPKTTADALTKAKNLRKPKTIRVWLNKTYPEIIGFGW